MQFFKNTWLLPSTQECDLLFDDLLEFLTSARSGEKILVLQKLSIRIRPWY